MADEAVEQYRILYFMPGSSRLFCLYITLSQLAN